MLGGLCSRNFMASRSSYCHPTAKPKVLVIAGVTSVGKTELSLRLAALLKGEVISADSVQVYRQLNIGSAKVSDAEAGSVRHHLLDVADPTDPDEIFSAKTFADLATKAIEDVLSRGRVPLIVGGTGLYLQTLLQGSRGSPPSTHESRAMVERIFKEEDKGDWETSFARLKAVDAVYAASLCTNDWYRLRRAMEICILSGRSVTSFKRKLPPEDWLYDAKCLFLSMPRVQLFERIDTRCEAIVEAGLFQEVIKLVKSGQLKPDSQAGRSVGYRQALDFLKDTWDFPAYQDDNGKELCPSSLKVSRDDLKSKFSDFLFIYKSRTRQLAKNQMVRFKKEPAFHWLNMAPGGRRLSVEDVAMVVAKWFRQDREQEEHSGVEGGEEEGAWLPSEWDGKVLQTLTSEEGQSLKVYATEHSTPTIYADDGKVAGLLSTIEELVTSSQV